METLETRAQETTAYIKNDSLNLSRCQWEWKTAREAGWGEDER